MPAPTRETGDHSRSTTQLMRVPNVQCNQMWFIFRRSASFFSPREAHTAPRERKNAAANVAAAHLEMKGRRRSDVSG